MIDLTFSKPIYNKSSPCLARIKEKKLLNGANSTKQTYHISLDIEGTGLHFHPGDSLGVLPQNDPKHVQHLLALLKNDPTETILDPRSQTRIDLESYFSSKVNLSRINSSLLRFFVDKTFDSSQKERFTSLLLPENKTALTEFTQGKDLVDIFQEFQEVSFSIQDLCEHFAPLLPRFYSISSSLKAHPEEVHLLVALSSYTHKNELRYGVASHFLCNLAKESHTSIPLYIQPTHHFKLPEDPTKDLIMIGPGTGVAPYKAFLQERMIQGSSGRNWLFFGERNRKSDFFYEDFWGSLEKENKLKLSTAFSRDQEKKEYVQHKLLLEGKEIWQWIETGAYFYVCGDATKMAKDVEATLIKIIQEHGSYSEESSKAYFKALKSSKRYLTDVY